MASVARCLAACAALIVAVHAEDYWWQFKSADCAYHDVHVNGSSKALNCCSDTTECTISSCEALCKQTKGCGGFNWPHGVVKSTDCVDHLSKSSVTTYILQDHPQPPPPSNFPPIWPHPKSFTNGTQTAVLLSTFTVTTTSTSNTVTKGIERYQARIFRQRNSGPASGSGLSGLVVTVKDSNDAAPQQGTDESYTLTIPVSGKATLDAPTVYGALRGLETFSQLVAYGWETRQYAVDAAPWSIGDAPRFSFRGLMVDTARHYLPLPFLFRILDGMEASKLNVLHWHHEDDQSFPTEFLSAPKMWTASYPNARFTAEDVQALVKYATLRGIRVLMEFDVPGHASSWCVGHPEVCPSPTCLTPLNVANNATFDLIDKLVAEVASSISTEKFIHMGGDEVRYDCWTKTPAIAEWLKERNMTTTDGYGYFLQRVHEIVFARNRVPINWVEAWERLRTKLDKRTVVHVWKARSEFQQVLDDGYSAILSDWSQWYLTGPHVTLNWTVFYDNEILEGVPPSQEHQVLGGEVCAWAESYATGNVEGLLFPRVAAVGEKLWSPRNINSTDAARPRLAAFNCNVLRFRGISTANLQSNDNTLQQAPVLFVTSPPGIGACIDQ